MRDSLVNVKISKKNLKAGSHKDIKTKFWRKPPLRTRVILADSCCAAAPTQETSSDVSLKLFVTPQSLNNNKGERGKKVLKDM